MRKANRDAYLANEMKAKGRKWLKVILWNMTVVFLIFCGLEWYLASKLNDPASASDWLYPALRKYYHDHDQQIIQYRPECAHYDSVLFYRLNPGSIQFNNREFESTLLVNSKGIRDDEESLDAPKIIVLGDSYTMGWGVQQHELYTSLLEERLGVKVLNAAISSYGTAREFRLLEELNTDSLEYLVIQYCPNDLIENQNFAFHQELRISSEEIYNTITEDHLSQTGYYLFKHIAHIPSYLWKSKESNNAHPGKADVDSAKLIGSAEAFMYVLEQSTNLPARTKIILFSMEAQKSDDTFINSIQVVLNKRYASSLHDRVSYMSLDQRITDEHRFVLDPHLNALGHQVIAEELARHLEGMDLSAQTKVWYYDSGDTSIVAEYLNGVKHGKFVTYWESGVKSSISHFEQGEQHGAFQAFNESGELLLRRYYWRGAPCDSAKFVSNSVVAF